MQASSMAVLKKDTVSHTGYHWLWLVLWATLLMLPLFLQVGFHSAPDIETHIYHTHLFSEELGDGILYPRWLGDLYWGYGSASGMLSKVLTYYLAGILVNLGMSPIVALKIVLWVTVIGAGWCMYRLAGEFLPSSGAITAALFYQAAPYAMIDLYSRMSLPEYMAFLWLPALLLLLFYCVERSSLIYPALFALCYTALMLTHFLVAYLMGIALVVLALGLLWRTRQPRRGVILRLVVAGLLTGGAIAFYLLPVLAENQYLNTRWFVEGNEWGNYRHNFLLNAQGYLNTRAEYLYLENTIIAVGALLSVVLAATLLPLSLRYRETRSAKQRDMTFLMLLVFFFSTLMAFKISEPLYHILPRLEMVQFPWRWQTVSTAAIAYLAGDGVAWFLQNRRHIRPVAYRLAAQVMLAAGLLHIFYSAFVIFSTLAVRDHIPEQNLQEVQGNRPIEASYMYRTFLPVWAAEVDFAHLQPISPRVTTDPPAEVEITVWRSPERVFTVNAEQPTEVRLHTFWFPGWTVQVDGGVVETRISSDDGTMLFDVPTRQTQIRATFENTPIRNVGVWLSTATGLLIMGLLMWHFLKQRGQQQITVPGRLPDHP